MSITRKGNQKNKGDRGTPRAHDSPARKLEGRMPGEIELIEDWLESVKFKKTTFGGVSEADVWKKISELNEMYETALIAERARYNMLLQAGSKKTVRAEAEKQSVSRPPVKRRSVKPANPEDEKGYAEDVQQASRSRDAPVQKTRQQPERQKKQEDTVVLPKVSSSKVASQDRKSARPTGVPFIDTDWLDDDDDWLSFDSETGSSGTRPNSRSREGGL